MPADTHHRAYLFGALDWLTGQVRSQIHSYANTDAFLAFLEYLLVE